MHSPMAMEAGTPNEVLNLQTLRINKKMENTNN